MVASEGEEAAEDEGYGPDWTGAEVPEHLVHRESRLKKIQEARAVLEAEAGRGPEEAGAAEPSHGAMAQSKAQRTTESA